MRQFIHFYPTHFWPLILGVILKKETFFSKAKKWFFPSSTISTICRLGRRRGRSHYSTIEWEEIQWGKISRTINVEKNDDDSEHLLSDPLGRQSCHRIRNRRWVQDNDLLFNLTINDSLLLTYWLVRCNYSIKSFPTSHFFPEKGRPFLAFSSFD